MFRKNLLIFTALAFAGAAAIATAQDEVAFRGNGTTVWGKHARMTVVTESARSYRTTNVAPSGLVTIFNNIGGKYPQGVYWCCTGYDIIGPAQGEQWMATAFTPSANHTVTRIEVAVGYLLGTNGVVLSLNDDNNGVPGKALKSWNALGLPSFGCCALVVKSDGSGIPIRAGKQYWVVLSTNSHESDTVAAWNLNDTDQVDFVTAATYTNKQWSAFQMSPGLAFAVKGSN